MAIEGAERILRNIHYINVRNHEKVKGNEQLSSGANILKKKIFLPWQKDKTISERNLCKILVDLEVASSEKEALGFVGNLDNLHIEYAYCSRLSVQRIANPSGANYHFSLYFYD